MIRTVLSIEMSLVLIQYGIIYGTQWALMTWPLRVAMMGLGGLLTFILAGQAKAFNLDIPVDGYTYFGLGAATLALVGQAFVLIEQHRQHSRG